MSDETNIARLGAENAELRAALMQAQETITGLTAQAAALLGRVAELEKQRAATSRNSSKPPSSDGPARRPKSLRGRSGKKPGGQPEHPGAHLRLVETPDHVVVAQPLACGRCQGSLTAGALMGLERRHVI